MLFLEIALTAFVSALLQLVFHLAVAMYFPHLGRINRYVLGTLGLLLPVSAYLALNGGADHLLVIWACAGASGIAVTGAYRIGDEITRHRNERDAGDRMRALLDAQTQEEE